jgi:hypothetical protein
MAGTPGGGGGHAVGQLPHEYWWVDSHHHAGLLLSRRAPCMQRTAAFGSCQWPLNTADRHVRSTDCLVQLWQQNPNADEVTLKRSSTTATRADLGRPTDQPTASDCCLFTFAYCVVLTDQSSNSTAVRFVVDLFLRPVQQIHDKSNEWSLSFIQYMVQLGSRRTRSTLRRELHHTFCCGAWSVKTWELPCGVANSAQN